MWLLTLIPVQFRLWVAISVGMVLFLAGWHAQTIWDGYRERANAVAEAERARKGQLDIVKFNSDFAKERKNAKDDTCIDKPMPDGIRLLLAK